MKDKEKQIEEIYNLLFCDKWEQPFMECPEDIKCIECVAKTLYNAGYRKIDKDSVVLSKEEYEKLKKYEYKVQCGVCFTQKEWFDFINEDSNFRTSLQIKAEEKGYEQAHKEMLKDCIESNKIAEQIGYEKGSKETAEKILKWLTSKRHLFNRTHEVGFEKPITSYLVLNDEIEELAKQYGIEIMVEIKE